MLLDHADQEHLSGLCRAAQQPALSRRHEAGAGSARGLLFTLLGEFVLPSEGAAWTSAVLAAFERLGVAEKATRQALMRTVQRRLAAGGEGRPPDPLAADPGREEAADRRGQAHLLVRPGRGVGRPVGAGAGAHPRVRPAGQARGADPARLGRVRLARPRPVDQPARQPRAGGDPGADRGRGGQGRARVRGPRGPACPTPGRWSPRPGTCRRSRRSTSSSSTSSARPGSPGDVLLRQLELVHAWRRFPALDPSLPRELLPPRWTGIQRGRAVRRPAPAVAAGRPPRVAAAQQHRLTRVWIATATR